MGRLIQRIMRRIVRALLVRPMIAVAAIAIAVIAVASIAAMTLLPGVPRPDIAGIRSPFGGDASATSDVTHDAPPSTESYLKGNQIFNADMMWSALSSDAQDRFRSRGATAQDLQ